MSSYVYFIGSVNLKTNTLDAIKVGKANNPLERLKELQTASKDELVLLGDNRFENDKDARLAETRIHTKYAKSLIRGEWYQVTPMLLKEIYIRSGDNSFQTDNTPLFDVEKAVLGIIADSDVPMDKYDVIDALRKNGNSNYNRAPLHRIFHDLQKQGLISVCKKTKQVSMNGHKTPQSIME